MIALVVTGAAAVVVSGAAARKGVPRWETDLFRKVRGTPRALTAVLFLPMQLGAAAAPPLVGGAAAWVGLRRRSALGVAVCGLGAWWAGKGVKWVVGRKRPHHLVPGATVAAGGSRDGLGFVSGHAAVGAATAVVLTPVLPRRWRLLPAALVAVISFARVQNGSHLPLDVVGGVGLGMVLGGGWRLAAG
jgi:membrane-associated phospholipid phosphatase